LVNPRQKALLMSIFRCYFLDGYEHIAASEDIDAVAADEAIDRARAMLRRRSHHRGVEVWQGARRLYVTDGVPPRLQPYVRGH
jgi:hypothetical protein